MLLGRCRSLALAECALHFMTVTRRRLQAKSLLHISLLIDGGRFRINVVDRENVYCVAGACPLTECLLSMCTFERGYASQVVPKIKKWTSGFRTCAGGYLRGNHITLVGLTRLAEQEPCGMLSDWTTAINI